MSIPPPMTMIINIPERVLWINVARMPDLRGDTAGHTLMFYDITGAVFCNLTTGQSGPCRTETVLPVSRTSVPRLLQQLGLGES